VVLLDLKLIILVYLKKVINNFAGLYILITFIVTTITKTLKHKNYDS